jgi:hypothetical protein
MSGYIGTQPVPQATQTRDSFTATSGQTSFATGGYTPNYLDVYLNGVKLASADYTATNGSDVVLASGASTGDILEVVAFTTFTPADLPAGTPSIDDNGNAVALTITSDEQVLIGKTSTGLSVTGTQITSDGRLMVTRDGNQAADFNRKSSDGDIVKFQKDGTTVGSIKARYDYTTLQIGSTGTGITGTSSHKILPSVNNARSDNTNDLGDSSYRWKDLYISGAVYLGGVGSANKLEDYEEGTWTPVDGSGQVTLTDSPIGVYTKVGRQVTVIAYFAYPSTSQTNYAIVAGLPFTVSNYSNAMYAPGSIQTSYISSTNRHLAPLAYRNTNTFYFYDSELPLTNANLSGKNFRINITYFTDA